MPNARKTAPMTELAGEDGASLAEPAQAVSGQHAATPPGARSAGCNAAVASGGGCASSGG
jgi:hypothetical protein